MLNIPGFTAKKNLKAENIIRTLISIASINGKTIQTSACNYFDTMFLGIHDVLPPGDIRTTDKVNSTIAAIQGEIEMSMISVPELCNITIAVTNMAPKRVIIECDRKKCILFE